MRDYDLSAGVTFTTLVTPVSVTAAGPAAIGVHLDLSQYKGEGFVVLTAFNTAGAAPTLDVAAYDSADDSSYAAASPALAIAQVTGAGGASAQQLIVDVRKLRKWMKLYATVGGTSSPAWTVGAVFAGRKSPI